MSKKSQIKPVYKEFNINFYTDEGVIAQTIQDIDNLLKKYPNAKLNVEITESKKYRH